MSDAEEHQLRKRIAELEAEVASLQQSLRLLTHKQAVLEDRLKRLQQLLESARI